TAIRWGNIERLPFDEPLRGAFLVTATGKKYPALRLIASRLLANGEAVCLKEQGRNFYWYGDDPTPIKPVAAVREQRPAVAFAGNPVFELQPLVCRPS